MTKREKITARMGQAKTLTDKTVEVLTELPEAITEHPGFYTHLEPGELRIDLPYNLEMYKQIRRQLRGFRKVSARPHPRGWFCIDFKHRTTGIEFSVVLMAEKEGSTCHRVQVGEKTEPIYEIVCS